MRDENSLQSRLKQKQRHKREVLLDVTNNNITTMRPKPSKKPPNKSKALRVIVSTNDSFDNASNYSSTIPQATVEKTEGHNKMLVDPEGNHLDVKGRMQGKNSKIQSRNNLRSNSKLQRTNKNTFYEKSTVDLRIEGGEETPKKKQNRMEVTGNKKTASFKEPSVNLEALHLSQNSSRLGNESGKAMADRVAIENRPEDRSKVTVVTRNRKLDSYKPQKLVNSKKNVKKTTGILSNNMENNVDGLLGDQSMNNNENRSGGSPGSSNAIAYLESRNSINAVSRNIKNKQTSRIETVKKLVIALIDDLAVNSETTLKKKNGVNSRKGIRQVSKENKKLIKAVEPDLLGDSEICSKDSQNKDKLPEKPTAYSGIRDRLRKCEKKNYIESSPENSVCQFSINKETGIQNSNHKVPIYRQISTDYKQQKKDLSTDYKQQKKDPYEFDDLDLDVKNKNKKRENDDSSKFDKTMHELLQQLEKKEHKQQRKKKVGKPIVGPKKNRKMKPLSSPNYKEKIEKVMGKMLDKIKTKRKNCEKVHADLKAPQKNTGKKSFSLTDNHTAIQVKSNKINVISNIQISPTTENREEHCDVNGQRDDSPFFGFDRFENCNSPCNDADNISNCFGFCDNSTSPKEITDSNRHVDKSVVPEIFTPRRCNANSTMLRQRNLPWRSIGNIRNHYYINVKPNALPCLKQEPVIEHSLVEPIEERHSRFNSKLEVTKNKWQTSILDFVYAPDHSALDIEPVVQQSLYDYEDFNDKQVNKRPRVLSVLQTNQMISTPKKGMSVKVVSPDISLIDSSDDTPFCGFDNSVDTNKENVNLRKASPFSKLIVNAANRDRTYFGFDKSSIENVDHSKRGTMEKPFRANVRFKDFNTKDNGIDKVNTVPIEPTLPVLNNQDLPASEANQDMHLFDDPETNLDNVDLSITIPGITYERNRRKRLNCNVSDCSETEKPRKKKKDEMTKAEKAELEKWAQKFNSMCAEIDEYELDIE